MAFQDKKLLLTTIYNQVNTFLWHIENHKNYIRVFGNPFSPPYKWSTHPICFTYYNPQSGIYNHSCRNCINFIFNPKKRYFPDEEDPYFRPIEEGDSNDFVINPYCPCNLRSTWHVALFRVYFKIERVNIHPYSTIRRPNLALEAAKEFWHNTMRVVSHYPADKLIYSPESQFGLEIIQLDKEIYKKYFDIHKTYIEEYKKEKEKWDSLFRSDSRPELTLD